MRLLTQDNQIILFSLFWIIAGNWLPKFPKSVLATVTEKQTSVQTLWQGKVPIRMKTFAYLKTHLWV